MNSVTTVLGRAFGTSKALEESSTSDSKINDEHEEMKDLGEKQVDTEFPGAAFVAGGVDCVKASDVPARGHNISSGKTCPEDTSS